MIIRARTFESWMHSNFSRSEMSDIANHGADAGWHGLTYTRDCVKLFDRFGEEIWEMALEDSERDGIAHALDFVRSLGRSGMADSLDGFKTLMVWYAAERIASGESDDA